jgi:hypothetical protein
VGRLRLYLALIIVALWSGSYLAAVVMGNFSAATSLVSAALPIAAGYLLLGGIRRNGNGTRG